MRKSFYLILIPTLFLGRIILAQEQIYLGEVVVEAESLSKSLLLSRESVSGKYIIPRADLLGFGFASAGDVIKNLPMVYLDGDPGINRNVSIGGLAREYQAILINGRRPAGGEDSRDLKLDRIPVSMIERIEIDYNSPVSEGTGGIAGTVNIILKDSPGMEGLNIHLLTNLNTTDPRPGIRADIESSVKVGKTSVYGGLNYNSYRRMKTSELEDSSSEISGGIEELIITDVAAANFAARRNTGENSLVEFKGFFSWFDEDEFEDAEVKRRKDGTLNNRLTDTDNDKLRYLMTYDLSYRYAKGKNLFSVSGGFSNNYEKRHKNQLAEKSDYFEESLEYEDQDNYSFITDLLYTRSEINRGKFSSRLRTGLSASYNIRNTDRITASRPEGYLLYDIIDESYTLDETIVSAFTDLETRIGKKFIILPSLNYEYSIGGYETMDTTGNHSFSHLASSLHTKYIFSEKLHINGSLARHISRPAFMSMVPVSKLKIKKDLIEQGNPDLKPSRSVSADLGVSYFINEFSYVSLRGYYKWVRDMIQLKYTGIDPLSGYNLYSFVNIDTANVYGFYIDSRIDFDPADYSGFTLSLSYTLMASSTRDEYTGGIKRIDDQPAHLVNAKLDYLNTARKINLSAALNFNSARIIAPFLSDEMIPIPETREDPYISLAARIKYYINNNASFYLAGDNLLMMPVKLVQGTVTERSYPGAIIRLGFNYNLKMK